MSKLNKKVDLFSVKSSRSGRSSREKGKRAEREVAGFYRDRGLQARRGVQYKGGANSPDVVVTEIDKYFNHEVKWVENLNLASAMEQSKTDSTPEQVPLVIHKKKRTPWLVTLNLHDWLNVVQRLLGMDDSINTFPELKELRQYAKESLKELKAEEARAGNKERSPSNNRKKDADLL